jgi:hypothetical protein
MASKFFIHVNFPPYDETFPIEISGIPILHKVEFFSISATPNVQMPVRFPVIPDQSGAIKA